MGAPIPANLTAQRAQTNAEIKTTSRKPFGLTHFFLLEPSGLEGNWANNAWLDMAIVYRFYPLLLYVVFGALFLIKNSIPSPHHHERRCRRS